MIQIRLAHNSDATTLQQLFQQFVYESDWLSELAKKDPNFAASTQGEKVFVAQSSSGEIIGLMSVWEANRFVHNLYVASSHQGKGVGTQLLDSLEGWLPRPWQLKCVTANTRAIGFYRTKGWKLIETSTGEDGPYFLLEKG